MQPAFLHNLTQIWTADRYRQALRRKRARR